MRLLSVFMFLAAATVLAISFFWLCSIMVVVACIEQTGRWWRVVRRRVAMSLSAR
jgi:hypothetical protein